MELEVVLCKTPADQCGFTLIELIMVLVLIGILAVFVTPRLNVTVFEARGFHDGTLGYLRYAQKTAIAQRRTVCVNFGTSSLDLRVAKLAGSFVCAGAANGFVLNGPDGQTLLLGGSASYTLPTPTVLNFDALGQPVDGSGVALSAAQVVTVQGTGLSITVEAGSGYVHE